MNRSADMTPLDPKAYREAEHIFPSVYWQLFRRAFTPRALVFFEWYVELRRINLGKPIESDLHQDYLKATRILSQVKSPVDGRPLSPVVINRIVSDKPVILQTLRKINADQAQTIHWRNLNEVVVSFILEMCKDKGIYLKTIQRGPEQWPVFRKMSGRQKTLEHLKDEDPESYALIVQQQKSLAEIDASRQQALENSGLRIQTKMVAGMPVMVGHDPGTDERVILDRDGTRFSGPPPVPLVDENGRPVYRPQKDGEPRKQRLDWTGTAEEAFAIHTRAKKAAMEQLSRVPSRTDVNPESLRAVDDETLDNLPGKLEYKAITDDKAKQGRLTRIFATKRVEMHVEDEEGGYRVIERDVVVGDPKNRYRGCYLDDLINGQGRLIEGTAYTMDRRSGEKKKKKAPTRIDPSAREPYVSTGFITEKRVVNGKRITEKKKKLYVKIDGSRTFTPLMDAIKSLACNGGKGSKLNCVESIVMTDTRFVRIDPETGEPKIGPLTGRPVYGHSRSFYFDPKDFGLLMDALKGMSLSSAALDEVQKYYKELTLAERATDEDNLTPYSAAELQAEFPGGETVAFVTRKTKVNDDGTTEVKPFDLLKKQQQGLAWLDANGNSGVLALETGIGKTASGVGMMMKLARDGFLEEGAEFTKPDGTVVKTNGRFLFVCPKDLRGNMHKEIHKFISPAKPLADRVDVLSFREYSGSFHSTQVPSRLRNVPYWKARIEAERAKVEQGKKAAAPPAPGGKPKKPRRQKDPATLVWNPEVYVAIIFDEAHELKKPSTRMGEAALKTYNPRKICMTASPMETDPMDAYVMAAICNNTPLFGKTKEIQDNKKSMRRFKNRFCEVVGGRIIGVKQDPLVIRDMHTWVKKNIYHADKTQVEEYDLPELRPDTVVSEMPEPVERAYRDVSKSIAKSLQHAAKKFRERSDPYKGISEAQKKKYQKKTEEAERIFGMELRPVVKILNLLANRPAEAFKQMATLIEKGHLPGTLDKATGLPKPIPPLLAEALKKWAKNSSPDDMRMIAEEIGNPKVETAVSYIKTALAKAEGSRSLIFSDDPAMCREAVEYISRVVAGRHALCLKNEIHIYANGKPIQEIGVRLDADTARKLPLREKGSERDPQARGRMVMHSLPFKEQQLRKYPELRAHETLNKSFKADQWQQFVLQEIISKDSSVKTAVLEGQSYSHGHNLQAFSTVIHLDRDTWNSEAMKQRTARAWRQGQENGVDEITIDSTYPASRDEKGRARSDDVATLDDIRRVFQSMDGAIFDAIIKEAQGTELGAEWADTTRRRSSDFRLCQNTVALMLSPHVKNSQPPDCGKR